MFMEKKTASAIMLTLLLTSMLTLAFNIQPVKATSSTIVVPDDYPTIQEAINAASSGDTVYVKAGTYYENVVVNKTLSLLGENCTAVVDASGSGDVIFLKSSNVHIEGFTIRNGWGGIRLNSSENMIVDNKILNSYCGISTHTDIIDNISYPRGSCSNIIINNTIAENTYGLVVGYFDGNTLVNNIFRGNSRFGVWLTDSELNTFRNNTFVDNKYSLEVWASIDLLDFVQDIDTSNTVDGRPMYYLINQHGMVIEPSSFPNIGYLALVNSTNILVKDLDLQLMKNGQGILLGYCEGVSIINVTVSECYSGIYIGGSHNVKISRSLLFNNEDDAITVIPSSHYFIENNTMLYNTEGISVYQGCGDGVIRKNIMRNNCVGIGLGSGNHTVVENTIEKSSWYAMALLKSSWWYDYTQPNYIYHNNFRDNIAQISLYYEGEPSTGYIWDDGYPSGGNYWSDYTDVDLNNDGIWDHPYVIDENNKDRYPLVNPWTPTLPTPKITSIDPPQPIASPVKQLLSVLGEGFVPNSKVTLKIGSNVYPIDPDRTSFISSNRIEIIAGLTDPGLWQAWVTNPGDIQSEKYDFQVRSVSDEDIRKVLALALQYWTDEDAVIMTAIAGGESGWNPNAAGDRYVKGGINFLGYESWGLWQIHMPSHKSLLEILAQTNDPYQIARWLRDANNNVRAAYEVWKVQGFGAWSAYTQKDKPSYYKNNFLNRVINVANQIGISIYKCPVNVTIRDNYGRIISEVENQIPGASFEYFNATDTKIFYLPLNLTYHVQTNATAYGNITIVQITPTESIYEIAFSQVTFNLTSETVAEFDLLPYDANYTLKVDENGDGLIDYELAPEVETLTTEYDTGITEIVPSKTVIGEGYNLPINITVMNYGAYTETFNVTLYVNETFVELQTVTLASGNSTTVTFTWNTTGFAKGNYIIWAYAWPVTGENATSDNTLADGWLVITIPGDIDGNFLVDGSDLGLLGFAWYSKPGDPNWNPNADLNNDGLVDGGDLGILGFYWFQTGP